jgi:hypothetical protein
MTKNAPEASGIRASVRRVSEHARALVSLQKELARAEMIRKASSLGVGAGLAVGAIVVAVFALGFALAAAAAALAIVLDTWLALLVLCGVLLLVALVLGLGAVSLLRKATPLTPEQTLEEARLTRKMLKSGGS